ncbi:SUMF1/EgtB/PvdO family nonheme iron enzyme [Aquisalimonas lutea]|uniref:SUMF1/EgtB/PvdO family nonheme iron enzyme n=1 Tax=Aquisalimonas lutea TaxID=1327750 RepID=UPI0025B4D359|nr:SUMF1/EgtB/PvdO family nonheme iron enzyme [Aquisalimonas lutea]MDN3517250.1 SUMF1/EgtB/PvdO family nonheme iron enzyme [Aquisalimonas lutea]
MMYGSFPSEAARPPVRQDPLEALAWHHAWALQLVGQLDDSQIRTQYHPELSPVGWHIGHCALVEHFWIEETILGAEADEELHDLYFPERNRKEERGCRLPSGEALRHWAGSVHRRTLEFLAKPPVPLAEHPMMREGYLAHFLEQHYAQHCETLCYCLAAMSVGDHQTADLPLSEAVRPAPVSGTSVRLPAGEYSVGTNNVRGYDNERPAHTVCLAGSELACSPVTNAQWLAFMSAGGYDPSAPWWSVEGATWLRATGVDCPWTWHIDHVGRFAWKGAYGFKALAAEAPVSGVSFYEAHAFATWAGARLPHEFEWEAAADLGLLQNVGYVWEWCSNTLAPYPGFRAFPYDGYSTPWFDGHHFVLRGSSIYTEPGLRRHSFRNFFEPHARHHFGGLRLAFDGC